MTPTHRRLGSRPPPALSPYSSQASSSCSSAASSASYWTRCASDRQCHRSLHKPYLPAHRRRRCCRRRRIAKDASARHVKYLCNKTDGFVYINIVLNCSVLHNPVVYNFLGTIGWPKNITCKWNNRFSSLFIKYTQNISRHFF